MKPGAAVFAIVAAVFMALAPSLAGSAEPPLGRLFFTPERRAALERQRQYNVQAAETLQGESVSLDGIVTRSSGKSTVWINGRAQHDRSTATGVDASLNSADPGQAVITNGEEAPVSLRVGESANRATREKQDGLGGGKIVVKHGTAGP